MNITVEKNEDNLIIRVAGRLDEHTAGELETAAYDLCDDTDRLVFDFAELTYISESGLRLILSAYQVMWLKGGVLCVINCVPQVEEKLRITKLREIISYEDFSAADETKYDFDALRDEVQKRLSAKRFEHCMRVSAIAEQISTHFRSNAEKARIAGMLHDIAKEYSDDKLLEIARKNKIRISGSETKTPHKLHGKVGAIVVRDEFGIKDEEILSGIAHHYGYPEMTEFEEVIFIADIFDKLCQLGYKPSIDEILSKVNADEAIIYILGFALRYQNDVQLKVGPEVTMIYDYVMHNRFYGNSNGDDSKVFAKSRLPVYGDELFDKIFYTYVNHSVDIDSARNIRDLGGYHTYDGKTVKKHMLIRSGGLSHLTKEDANKFKQMGISHIIDFRGENKRTAEPDANTEDFINVVCELKTIRTQSYQENLIEEAAGLEVDRLYGYAWMNGEFLRGLDIEQMYKDSLQLEDAVQHLRDMLYILISDDCTGAILHCKDGKDRTGIAATIILTALGVYDEEVLLDYMASAIPEYVLSEIYDDYFTFRKYDEEIIVNSRREKSVDYKLSMAIEEWFVEKYGDVDNYLRTILKLDDDFVCRFREKFLEER